MKFLALFILLIGLCEWAFAEDMFNHSKELFSKGKYQSTIEELDLVQKKNKLTVEQKGFVFYWKGICFARLQNFGKAAKEFKKSLKVKYAPLDIHYEYGQALFALDRLEGAREQFRLSVKNKFKEAVSLYYLGFIEKEKGNKKAAFKRFKRIHQIEDKEAQDVLQSAELQIADMYLDECEKKSNPLALIRDKVIPQYEKALEVNDDSALAPKIKDKIKELQKKYELVLFQLINGRRASYPQYFLKLNAEVGHDSNVTFSPTETTVASAKQASFYNKLDILGRYTFYPKNFISLSPEVRGNRTRYFNRIPEIYRNDNFLLATALRTAYEHEWWKKPASVLFDIDYSLAERDVNSREKFDFNSHNKTFMIGERFNYISLGETILRYRKLQSHSYAERSDFKTESFVLEQVASFKPLTLIFVGSYDRRRGDSELNDTNAHTLRTDFVFNRVKDWFTPSLGMSFTTTNPYNNLDVRGREFLYNPSIRLAKTFFKKWRSNLKYDFSRNISRDKDNFAYKKSVLSLDLEYVF